MEIKKFLYFICSLLQLGIAIGIVVGYLFIFYYGVGTIVEYNAYLLNAWSIMGWIGLIKNLSFLILSLAIKEGIMGWWDFYKGIKKSYQEEKLSIIQLICLVSWIIGGAFLMSYYGYEEGWILLKSLSLVIGIILTIASFKSPTWRKIYFLCAMGTVMGVTLPYLVGALAIRWLQKIKKKYFLTINYK